MVPFKFASVNLFGMGNLGRIIPKVLILVVLFSSFLGTSFAEEDNSAYQKWEFDRYSDGIDNFIYVDQEIFDDQITLRIYCEKRRIGAWISAEYANSTGWKGVAQIRFDSKPVKKLSYTVNRQFDTIYIDNPKAFISELLKSKKVLIKIGTVDGFQLSTFYSNDLRSYRKQFSAKGCNLG